MSSDEWANRVINAALDIARAAPSSKFSGSVAEWVGRILLLLARAAGHADRMTGRASHARVARNHFRTEMQEAAATALALLQESSRRQQLPARANEAVTGDLARQKVLSADALAQRGQCLTARHPTARHPTAGLGAAIAAVAMIIPTVPLDDAHLPELDHALENVVAHAMMAVALTDDAPETG